MSSGGNGGNGITIETANNTIGGMASNQGNILGSNSADGISIPVFAATSNPENNNLIVGNFIGTDATGPIALGNGVSGVSVFSRTTRSVAHRLPQRNLISGNGLDGINLTNAAATGNLVQGNFIGTDVTGNNKLGNAQHGVAINSVNGSASPSGSNNTIGGSESGAGNVISGNGGFGVVIFGPDGSARRATWCKATSSAPTHPGSATLATPATGLSSPARPGIRSAAPAISARNVIGFNGNGRFGVVIESNPSTGNLIRAT